MQDIVYIESEDLKILADQLREKYFLHLGHVDLDAIYFVEKVGDEPKKIKVIEILGVTNGGIRQMLQQVGRNQSYCMQVWQDAWNALHPYAQQWLMFEVLYSIKRGNEGYLKKPDVVEYGPIIEYFASSNIGIHWRENQEDLPDMLAQISLPMPLPPDEDEESAGSTN